MFPLTPTSNLDAHHVLPGRSKSFCSTTSPWPKITWLRNSEEMASGKWRESRGWCTRGFGFFFRRVVVCGWRCDFLDRSESFYKVYISYKDVISDEVNMATKLNMYLYLNIYIYTLSTAAFVLGMNFTNWSSHKPDLAGGPCDPKRNPDWWITGFFLWFCYLKSQWLQLGNISYPP